MSGEAPESGGGQTPSDPPPTLEVPTRVFISYASQDAAVAEQLCAALEAAGLPCWIAPRDVRAGESYAAAIVQAINSCRMLVLLLSQAAIDSPHVLREVERASSKRRPVLSVRMDAAKLPPDLEYFLSANQWFDASGRPIEQILPAFVESVRSHESGMSGQALSAGTAAARSPSGAVPPPASIKSPFRWRTRATAIALAVAAVAVAYVLANKLWVSKHAASSAVSTAVSARPQHAAVPEKSIAVLPFVDMSEKHDQEYFSDGLSEELIDLLTKVPDLRVPARTSSFFFKGKTEDIEGIAQKLRVAHVLEGSVRKAANTIRVTAQLIQADNGYHLWSETYDRELKDVFKVQDEIAAAVVSALKLKLASGPQVGNSRRTSIPDAYNQYLLGRQFYERKNEEGYRRAVKAYRKAIELDPRYAAAYAELALSEGFAEQTDDPAVSQRALALADKAVELAPDEADGYAVRGYLRLTEQRDWTGAQADLEKALALDSRNSKVLEAYAELLDALGRLPQAIAVAKTATELDPLSNTAWTLLGLYLVNDRQFAAAHETLRRALEIQPESPEPLSWLGELQLLEGNAAEALTTFRRVDFEGFRLWGVAMAEHTLGHAQESQRALDELIAKHAQGWAYTIATVYAWRAEKDKAFEWLERTYQQRESDLKYIKDDLLLAPLRGDPRYKALLRKMNLPES